MSVVRPTVAAGLGDPEPPPQVIDAPAVEPIPTHHREVLTIVARIRGDHPEVPVEVITELVDTAFTDLGSARVQAFRHILAERAARRQLQAEARRPASDSPEAPPKPR